MKQRIAVLLSGLVLFLASGAARAEGDISSLDTVYFEVGYVQATGAATFGSGAGQRLDGTGLRYYERHCCLARLLAGITVGLLMGAGAASPYKNIDSKTYQSGDYVVTETTYTYYTEEEKRANREAAAKATEAFLTFPFIMELVYFPQKDDGKLYGFQWTWYFVEFPKRSWLRLETGAHWDRLGGRVDDPAVMGGRRDVLYKNIGIPVRIVGRVPGYDFFQADIEWRWNLYGQDDVPAGENHNEMLRASATLQFPFEWPLLQMIYGRATVQSNRITDVGRAGFMIEFGARL